MPDPKRLPISTEDETPANVVRLPVAQQVVCDIDDIEPPGAFYSVEAELERLSALRTANGRLHDSEPAIRLYLDNLEEISRTEEEIKDFVRTTGITNVSAGGMEAFATAASRILWDAAGIANAFPWTVGAGIVVQSVDAKKIGAAIKNKLLPETVSTEFAATEPLTTRVTIRVAGAK